MKSFILVVLFCSFFVSCREGREKIALEQERMRDKAAQEEEKLRNEEKALEQEGFKSVARHITENLIYIQDARTNFCFAYLCLSETGGPALATVPCVDVPKDLLVIPK